MTHNSSPRPLDMYQPVVKQASSPSIVPVAEAAERHLNSHNKDPLLQEALTEIQIHREQQAELAARERVLAQVIERICRTLNIQKIFSTATAELRQLLHVDRVAIFQFNLDAQDAEGEFVAEDVALEFDSVLTAKASDHYFEDSHIAVYREGQIQAIPDTHRAGFSESHLRSLERFKIRANLVVPLLSRQQLWGLLCIHQCCGARQWQSAEVEFASRIALQLGVALQQAELIDQARLDSAKIQAQKQQLERVAKQERTLAQVIECIRQTLDIQQIFATATSLVRQLLQADRVAIYRFELGTDTLEGEFVAEDAALEFDSVLTLKLRDRHFGNRYAQAYRLGQVVSMTDTYDEPLSDAHFQILSRLKVRADLVIPLLHGKQVWGLLCVHQCCGPREWKTSEVEFTTRIAVQLGVALQQAELYGQTQAHALELQQALAEVKAQKEQLSQVATHERISAYVMRRIRQSLDVKQIFRAATEEVRQILKCDRVVVYQFLPDWGGMFISESAAPSVSQLLNGDKPIPWNDSYLQDHQGGRYQNLEPSLTPDIYQANYAPCHIQKLEELQIRASMIVPVLMGDTLWGLLGAYHGFSPRDWQPWELQLLEKVGDQLGVALQQAELLHQLKQAKEGADAASQSKSAFLASMSHELRTPLNAILGFSQLLTRDPNLTPAQKDTLDIINRSGAHLLDLMNDVLEMSKIEAGKATVNAEDFNLLHLLQSLHDLFSLKAQSKGLELIFDSSTAMPLLIHTDEGKLRQILINVLGNAIKFTESGRVTLRVNYQRLEAASELEYRLIFSVEDTGPGIASEDLGAVFDAFTQTKAGRQSAEGTGLGLPISRHFARLMGGDITLMSKLGLGTAVQIQIQAKAARSINALAPVQRVIGMVPGQPDYRILVVEDQPESRQLLVQLLSTVGFRVQTAENGEVAIALWQSWQPHLIWMDWQLPILNGFKTTQQIRRLESATPQLRKTPILAVTASAFSTTCQETLLAGCDDFMLKPFAEHELFDKMTQHLGVEYVYETPAPVPMGHSETLTATEIEQQMAQLPPDWLVKMLQAAVELDEDTIPQLILRIEAQNGPLARELTALFKAFRLDKLADYAQQALSGN